MRALEWFRRLYKQGKTDGYTRGTLGEMTFLSTPVKVIFSLNRLRG